MKYFFYIIFFSFLTFCSSQKDVLENGFIEISVYPNFTDNHSYSFIKNGKTYAKIENDTLYVNNLKLSFFDSDPKILQEYLNSDYLFPDYGIWYIKGCKNIKGDFYFFKNKKKILIEGRDMLFVSYEDFLSTKLIRLNNQNIFFEDKDVKSKLINNATGYDYELVSYQGDWIKIKTSDKFLEPGDKSYKDLSIYKEGWVKWKKDDKVLIDLYFD